MQCKDALSSFSHEMPPTKAKQTIPGAIRDELRAVAAIKCFEIVCRKGSLKLVDQQSYIYKYYHGDSACNVPSTLDQLLEGDGPFENLYQKTTSHITDPDSVACSAEELILREEFTRLQDRNFIVGTHITRNVLSQKTFTKSEVVTGRTLHAMVREVRENVRKAHAFLVTVTKDDGTPLRSGTTRDDIIAQLLQHMYKEIVTKGGGDKYNPIEVDPSLENHDDCEKNATPSTDSDSSPEITDDDDTPPPGWFFRGFYTILLFGRLAVDTDARLACLATKESDVPAAENLSRASMRFDRKRRAEELHAGMGRSKSHDDSDRNKLLQSLVDINRNRSIMEEERLERERQDRQRKMEMEENRLERERQDRQRALRISVLRDLISDAKIEGNMVKLARLQEDLEKFIQDLN